MAFLRSVMPASDLAAVSDYGTYAKVEIDKYNSLCPPALAISISDVRPAGVRSAPVATAPPRDASPPGGGASPTPASADGASSPGGAEVADTESNLLRQLSPEERAVYEQLPPAARDVLIRQLEKGAAAAAEFEADRPRP